MNLLRHICGLLALLGAALAIRAAVTDLPVKTINGHAYHYYTVESKETLYGIQQKLGVDQATILKYNPSVADGLKAHQTLYFPADDFAGASEPTPIDSRTTFGHTPSEPPAQEAAPTVRGTLYTIQDGETLYGIGRKHGVTTDDILRANPGLSPTFYQSGQVIVIPDADTALQPVYTPSAPSAPSPTPSGFTDLTDVSDDSDEYVDSIATEPSGRVSIAVLLPFMLSQKAPDKTAQRYTEFYKGLLLAVDTTLSVRRPVTLYAFDTAGSSDTVRAILRRPELQGVQAVIAPPDAAQLAAVARWGQDNNVLVINPFLVRDNTQATNPHVAQAGTPSDLLVAKAVDGAVDLFSDRTPVILRRNGSTGDHADFVNALKEAYLDADATPVIITYTGELTPDNLKRLDRVRGPLLFVPTEGKLDEAKKYLPVLADYAAEADAADPGRVMLMGYPEWVTFRGDTRQQMHKANTVVYSRFFADDDDPTIRRANSQFASWYGSPTEAALPRQGLLGLDLGTWLIEALRATGGDFSGDSPRHYGIQNSYDFKRLDGDAGLTNDVIYFINYRPSGIVDRTVL